MRAGDADALAAKVALLFGNLLDKRFVGVLVDTGDAACSSPLDPPNIHLLVSREGGKRDFGGVGKPRQVLSVMVTCCNVPSPFDALVQLLGINVAHLVTV